jgi:multidrug resistance efflux pump
LRIERTEAEAACTEAQAQASICRSELEEYNLAISLLQAERAAHAKVRSQERLSASECARVRLSAS